MAAPVSTYRERLPLPALAGHVLCVWSQVIGDTGHQHRVLPDGCADLVWIGAAPAVVAGPATGPVMVPLAPGTIVTGVRLRPGAAAMLGPAVSTLANRDTPLRDIWGADPLAAEIAGRGPIEARLAAAQAMLGRRLADAGPPDRELAAATRWLARHPTGRIEDLSYLLATSPRRLHRRFLAAVGYGPKTLQRVLRLQRVLALAARRHGSLAALAADAGYADQAHMSREVQALAGRGPRGLLQGATSTLALSDLFKTRADPVR
jgi:AraC-like DNA-binding protein